MLSLLWLNLLALAAGSVVAVLDLEVEVGRLKVGRAAYGALVLAGLLGVHVHVLHTATLPAPGYGILFFAVLYLPFLSQAFIDLELTDRIAQQELQKLLLNRSYGQLRGGSGEQVIKVQGRRLKLHWETSEDDCAVHVELDVHPSTLPVTVSRPHVATIRGEAHLNHIREEIRRNRESSDRREPELRDPSGSGL